MRVLCYAAVSVAIPPLILCAISRRRLLSVAVHTRARPSTTMTCMYCFVVGLTVIHDSTDVCGSFYARVKGMVHTAFGICGFRESFRRLLLFSSLRLCLPKLYPSAFSSCTEVPFRWLFSLSSACRVDPRWLKLPSKAMCWAQCDKSFLSIFVVLG